MVQAIATRILASIVAPIILIHGYSDDASVWDTWVSWLRSDNFTNIYPITFKNNDQCGTVQSHAAELKNMINTILNDTDSDQVNIVAHSKGGLDARSYISQNPGKVDNLIMIATPNQGTPAAYMEVTSCMYTDAPGRADLEPNSQATNSPDSNSTKYWTIAGNLSDPCYFVLAMYACHAFPNDGFVTVESALSHYKSLGIFNYNHTTLLTEKDVYHKVLPILE